MKDEVVFAEPFVVGLDECRRGSGKTFFDGFGCASGKVDLPDPAAGEFDEGIPSAGEGELVLVDDAEDAVVVILDGALELLAAVEDEGIEGFDDRGALVDDVSLCGMLDAGGLYGLGLENGAELVEADGFGDVELEEDEDRALQ